MYYTIHHAIHLILKPHLLGTIAFVLLMDNIIMTFTQYLASLHVTISLKIVQYYQELNNPHSHSPAHLTCILFNHLYHS